MSRKSGKRGGRTSFLELWETGVSQVEQKRKEKGSGRRTGQSDEDEQDLTGCVVESR